MTRFDVMSVRASDHAETIRSFWDRHLAGTPMGRLEWLDRNPAGPAIWIFARDPVSGEIAGMITVTPKHLEIDGTQVAVGISGDLMVAEAYRVFSPTLPLIRAAVSAAAEKGLSWLYTVPNSFSLKLAERVGFRRVGNISQMVRPVRSAQYLERRLPATVAKLGGATLDGILNALSRDSYGGHAYTSEELTVLDSASDLLKNRWQPRESRIRSACDVSYLVWRYLENPMYRFRLLGLRDRDSGRLTGILPFTRIAEVLRIYDVIAEKPACLYPLLRELRAIARQEGCKSIEIAVTRANEWRRHLQPCGYFDSRADHAVYALGLDASTFGTWAFFGGDRNI